MLKALFQNNGGKQIIQFSKRSWNNCLAIWKIVKPDMHLTVYQSILQMD